ncbi:Metallo-dependent hydrolase [Aspergillus campestris IBT 28561]|uniref:Dipeptidase n=1 Tax=Aspergillus campestris (strain IBT 28561) TaxID=1392248 RepID=A0A2I1D8E3_ASPC2|nr:Metallo-dependent hydrolase [Aspergillus campestris IBT 28561]PKY06144.1 Metallo-dependent hydrolase [Aspergillus campestris IBT 28561]
MLGSIAVFATGSAMTATSKAAEDGVSPYAQATIDDVADHIQYIGCLLGYRHVDLGPDFDGMSAETDSLNDVSQYSDVMRVLLDRSVGMSELPVVVRGDVFRILRAVENVATSLRERKPLENDVRLTLLAYSCFWGRLLST